MKRKATYEFIEFVRPDSYWPHPYTVEQALGVFRWMVETGWTFGVSYSEPDVLALLSGQPSCVNFASIRPIRSVDDLRERFQYAILANAYGRQAAWKKKHRIRVGASQEIAFPHYKPFNNPDFSEAEFKVGLNKLLSETRKLKVQLNPMHKAAKECYGVRLCMSGMIAEWRFVLSYGYDGSVWEYELARQEGEKEAFMDTFKRANAEFERLV